MSTKWNSPRGELLFALTTGRELGDPDAREYPTPREAMEREDALMELTESADEEQVAEFVQSATEFLRARGTTFHEFSMAAVARVTGDSAPSTTTLHADEATDRLLLTSTLDTTPKLEDVHTNDAATPLIEAGLEMQEVMDAMAAIDFDTSIRTDTFRLSDQTYTGTDFLQAWRHTGATMEHHDEDAFWVRDYITGQQLIHGEE